MIFMVQNIPIKVRYGYIDMLRPRLTLEMFLCMSQRYERKKRWFEMLLLIHLQVVSNLI